MYSMVTWSPFFGLGPFPSARVIFSNFEAILFEEDKCRVAMDLGAAALNRNKSECRWGVIDDIVLAEDERAWWGAADRVRVRVQRTRQD